MNTLPGLWQNNEEYEVDWPSLSDQIWPIPSCFDRQRISRGMRTEGGVADVVVVLM